MYHEESKKSWLQPKCDDIKVFTKDIVNRSQSSIKNDVAIVSENFNKFVKKMATCESNDKNKSSDLYNNTESCSNDSASIIHDQYSNEMYADVDDTLNDTENESIFSSTDARSNISIASKSDDEEEIAAELITREKRSYYLNHGHVGHDCIRGYGFFETAIFTVWHTFSDDEELDNNVIINPHDSDDDNNPENYEEEESLDDISLSDLDDMIAEYLENNDNVYHDMVDLMEYITINNERLRGNDGDANDQLQKTLITNVQKKMGNIEEKLNGKKEIKNYHKRVLSNKVKKCSKLKVKNLEKGKTVNLKEGHKCCKGQKMHKKNKFCTKKLAR